MCCICFFFFFFFWTPFFPVTCSSDGVAGKKIKIKTKITPLLPRLDIFLPTADSRGGGAPQEKMNIHQREKCLHVNECTCEMRKWRRAETVPRKAREEEVIAAVSPLDLRVIAAATLV